ncbi:MAG: hypothetical protein ISS70_25335 [Phycisphaerae bacterium]|nr:hypothetical protein [Phycisphaerae bacterium]
MAGRNFTDVNDAGRGNTLDVLLSQSQGTHTYDPPGRLDFGQTYYWRIDQVSAAPDSAVFKGNVWSFTVEPYSYVMNNIHPWHYCRFRRCGG